MRILIATFAERTHFIGMVPLAWALRAAGHEVRVASQPALTGVVAETGLTAVPVGRDHLLTAILGSARRLGAAGPAFDLAADPEELDWDRLRKGYAETLVPLWWKPINEPMIAELTEFCQWWRPDLVLWEPLTYAGALAAEACGALHARVPFALDLTARLRARWLRLVAEDPSRSAEDPLARWLGARAAARGVEFSEALTLGRFTIDAMPPSVRPGSYPEQERLAMRFVDYNGRAVLPGWLRREPERPRVCLTLGTTASERTGGYAVPIPRLLEALAEVDVEVVLPLPEPERAALGAVPGNVRMTGFVPLHALAPTCAALINHGGASTVCTGLLYGVPQLLVTDHYFDEPLWGERLTGLGAGLALRPDEATPQAVRDGLGRLLGEPGFRDAAARIGAEMRAMPAPTEVAAELARRVAEHRS
ncbi:activator-dependent family glycosyltransferase [Nonomuraea sp. CA-218870]|uniref:activator-dependent family glycosyltransferase n=1 Tax=Nonomuraea sp. CA-218870 TaxID=3239998 RepID=UPI003D938F45